MTFPRRDDYNVPLANLLSAMSCTNPNFRQAFSQRGLNEQNE